MLRALEIKNFTVFEEAKLEFSPGLNVVIGENGTGKSHLLKLGYSMMQVSFESGLAGLVGSEQERITRQLLSVFQAEKLGNLISNRTRNSKGKISTFFKRDSENLADFNLDSIDIGFDFEFQTRLVSWRRFTTASIVIRPLVIPTKEILSIYYGFAAALRNRELGFDSMYLELADALALTPLKGEAAKPAKSIIETLEKQMDGKVVVENGRFYISSDNLKLEMPLVAEGIRKIAMLAYLLMNGSLQKGTTLFWDEPETNLNPKMIRHLAETLVVLSSMGIQIVLATHSLFLLRELQIQLSLHPNVPAQFFALKREGKSVTVQQGNSIDDVDPIASLDADLEQSDRYLELT